MQRFERALSGGIGIMVDENYVRTATIGQGGILPAKELAFVFTTLRANDLIWAYVVNNYLRAQPPTPSTSCVGMRTASTCPGQRSCGCASIPCTEFPGPSHRGRPASGRAASLKHFDNSNRTSPLGI